MKVSVYAVVGIPVWCSSSVCTSDMVVRRTSRRSLSISVVHQKQYTVLSNIKLIAAYVPGEPLRPGTCIGQK